MISLYQVPGRQWSWRVAGPVLLTAALASGCSAASSSPTPSSGASSGPGSTSFRQCMQKHGVSLPGFGGSRPGRPPTPGSAQPTPGSRPAGAGSSAFRKAIQACGGGLGGGGFPGGGNGPG
jgi:hypothetical protein